MLFQRASIIALHFYVKKLKFGEIKKLVFHNTNIKSRILIQTLMHNVIRLLYVAFIDCKGLKLKTKNHRKDPERFHRNQT